MKTFDGQKGKRLAEVEYETYTHKKCPACGRTRSVRLFYRKKTRTARGWAWDSKCIDCRRSECRLYGIATRGRRNARLRSWRATHREAAGKIDRRRRLRRAYGLSEEQVESLRVKQNGRCAICQRESRRLFIDHCHTTQKVRGLLCQTCNTFLGWYEKKAEIIEAFQRYLTLH